MKLFQLLSALAVSAALIAGQLSPEPPPSRPGPVFVPADVRVRTDLDQGWTFAAADPAGAEQPGFDDAAWSRVTLPHTWNAQDGQDGGNSYRQAPSWYRKHFSPSPLLWGKRLWLDFGGATQVTDVYVNGVPIGHHEGGFAGFRFDATDQLKPFRDNVIAVRVDNRRDPGIAPNTPSFTMFGGLYRDVALLATDPLQITTADYGGPGVYLRTPSVSAASAVVQVTTKLLNGSGATRDARVRAVITDDRNRVVGETSMPVSRLGTGTTTDVVQTLTVANPHLWNSTADPYLYRTTVEVFDGFRRVDSVTQPLGIRSYTVDADQGLLLNGKHLEVHGVGMHQDRLDKGYAIAPADRVQDFRMMKEMGVNSIRTTHYQFEQHAYDLADAQGVIMYTEIPLINNITFDDTFKSNVDNQLRELIRQNYNHPSVFFWGAGNELYGDTPASNAFLQHVVELAHAEDPSRPTSYASCCNWEQSDFNAHTDIIGFNRYDGWYYNISGALGPWFDALHKNKPGWKLGLSEYGAGASAFQHADGVTSVTPASPFHPEEYQAKLSEDWWNQLKTRPYIWGSYVFMMFDAAAEDRNEGDTTGRNDKGLVTYDRTVRKDAFYWYKANWTDTPFVHLNDARWTSRTVATTDVKVYANAGDLTLKVNGVQVGPVQSGAAKVATWPGVSLAQGKNVVTVSGICGGVPCADTAVWTVTG
jgi:beta-galactosidase